ncbi:TPA: hypothetical protein ACX6PJ_000765 [Photobacterium damselae]
MGVYRDGSRHSLTKSVNDNQVATVNEKGQVQALGVERGRSRSFHVSAVFVQTVQIWGSFWNTWILFNQIMILDTTAPHR